MPISFAGLSGGGGKIEKIEEFTSTSSWTCPDDVSEIYALVSGGGGGGVYSSSNSNDIAVGAFGSIDEKVLQVTPGQTYTITVGAGGSATEEYNGTNLQGGLGSTSSIGNIFSVSGGGGALTIAGGSSFPNANALNTKRPAGFGGTPGFTGYNLNETWNKGATEGLYGRAGGGGAIRSGQVIAYGVAGGATGYVSNSDQNTTASAKQNSGAGGAGIVSGSFTDPNNRLSNGGSGFVRIKYWTAG